MAKFSKRPALAPTSPIRTTGARTLTHEGGAAWERDAKSALFLLAVMNMVSEDTFYETGTDRDARYVALIRQVTAEDPAWMQSFIPWLRNGANMRSASIVAAVEYAKAGGPNARAVVNGALQRADEPGEAIAYLFSTYGRKLGGGLQRGIADAVTRLYTERNALKWDGVERPWRFADVIELVHPTPKADWQNDLFHHLLDKRHWSQTEGIPLSLKALNATATLRAIPENERRAAIGGAAWDLAGWSWEDISGWVPGGMDRQAWEAAIPNMGYMALLRNLRNFDNAGVSDEIANTVIAKLTDPEEVARSRQFPFRFLSAYREVPSLRWAYALEKALDLSMANVPRFPGKTLVLVDTSGSMQMEVSARSKRTRVEMAALFGLVIAKRGDHMDFVIYGNTAASHPEVLGMPTLRGMDHINHLIGSVGHGTETWASFRQAYQGHDRVVILTDEQAFADNGARGVGSMFMSPSDPSLPDCEILTWNLAGYAPAHLPAGPKRYSFGGMSDASFKLVPLLEGHARDGRWPWED